MGAWQEVPGEHEPEETKSVNENGKTIRIESGDSQPPVSVRITDSHRERPTKNLKPVRFSPDPEPKEPASTPAGIETPTKSEKAIEEAGHQTRESLSKFKIAVMGVMSLSVGAGMIGYVFAPEKYKEFYEDIQEKMTSIQDKVKSALTRKSSEPKSVSNAAPSNSALNPEKPSENLEKSAIPTTKEEFFAMIKSGKIKITPETFKNAKAAPGGKYKLQQNNMKAVILIDEQTSNGETEWRTIDNTINDKNGGKNIVIAVRVINPNDKKKLSFLNYNPIAEYVVEKDPGTHIYLFSCLEEENRNNRGNSVMLKLPGDVTPTGNTDFVHAYCKK